MNCLKNIKNRFYTFILLQRFTRNVSNLTSRLHAYFIYYSSILFNCKRLYLIRYLYNYIVYLYNYIMYTFYNINILLK